MNLFKKQKFSIRKFSVGIFSTVIATLTFLSHPGHAQLKKKKVILRKLPRKMLNLKLMINQYIIMIIT